MSFAVILSLVLSSVTSFAMETNDMFTESHVKTDKEIPDDAKQDINRPNPDEKKIETCLLKRDHEIMEQVRLLNSQNDMQSNTYLLSGATYTVSGTVSLPEGTSNTGGADIGIYFYTPTLKDNNEVMEEDGKLIQSIKITLNPGQTSATYSVLVPEGQYIIGARLLTGNANVISKMNYYSEVGSQLIIHAGDVVSVSSNVSGKNITLIKAERSISGRIYVGQNTPEGDINLTISAYCFDKGVNDNNNIYITFPFGQNYVDFEMGVEINNYCLYVNNVGKTISGTISLPEGGYINGGTIWGWVFAESVVSGEKYESGFSIDSNAVNYSVLVPADTNEKYIIYLYIYSNDCDTNIIRYKNYYYTGTGMSAEKDDAEAISVPEEGATAIDLILPKGKTISGKIILPPDAYMEGNLTEIDFRCRNEDNYIIEYYTVALASDLSYSVVVSPEVKGNYIFYMINRNPLSTGKSNIINKTYYYNKDGMGSDYDNASIITIGDSDVENINFTLETGKTISGTLCLPNGGYINNGKYEYKVIARDLERYEEYYTHLEISDSNVDYMIAVPKTSTADYILYIYCYRRMFNQEEDSNIYTNGTVYYSNTGIKYNSWDATKLSFENDQISGIQIVLPKVKAIIKGCVPRPIDYGYMGYMVCAEFIDGETYSANTYFGLSYENESKFAIQIPETESSNSFNIYYQIQYGSYGELDLPTSNVYINSNGSYTFDKSKASVYSLDNLSDIHFEFVENSEIDQAPPTVSIGDITDSLKIENGAVNGSVSANVSTSSAVNAKAIIAIYNRNKLVKVQQKVIKLYRGGNAVDFSEINVPYTADGEYYCKIMIWKVGTKIIPFCKAKTINIE